MADKKAEALRALIYTNSRREADKRLCRISLLATKAAQDLEGTDWHTAALLNTLSDLADLAAEEINQDRTDAGKALDELLELEGLILTD